MFSYVIKQRGFSLSHVLLLILGLAIFASSSFLWADTLYLQNGEQLEGKFLGLEGGQYKFKIQDGSTQRVPEEEVNDLFIGNTGDPQAPKSPTETPKIETPEVKEKKAPQVDREEPPTPQEESTSPREREEGASGFSMRLLLAPGMGSLKYNTDLLATNAPWSDIGSSFMGNADLEYPNSHSGAASRFSIEGGWFFHPDISLQFGLDYTSVSKTKNDKPLKISGPFMDDMGTSGTFTSETEYSYKYAYPSALAGLSYYIRPLDLHIRSYLRMPLSASYTRTSTRQTEISSLIGGMETVLTEETEGPEEKGSLKGAKPGFGFAFGKEWSLQGGKKIGVDLLYSIDHLELEPESEDDMGEEEIPLFKHSSIFHGIGVSISF